MTELLHLPARPGAPIACDMRTAADTPDQRVAEYRELFERARVRRERREGAVVFALRADPGVREHVEDLARREAACPFLEYRVETTGAEIVLTMAIPDDVIDRAGAEATLDAFHALPDAGPPASPPWP